MFANKIQGSSRINLCPSLQGNSKAFHQQTGVFLHVTHSISTNHEITSSQAESKSSVKVAHWSPRLQKNYKHSIRHSSMDNWWSFSVVRLFVPFDKDLVKLGNIVAETLLWRQMFPSLAARETYDAETNFAARKQKNIFAQSQKHFCFPDTTFASATHVSQFSQFSHDVRKKEFTSYNCRLTSTNFWKQKKPFNTFT